LVESLTPSRPVPLVPQIEPPRPKIPSTKPIDLMEEIRKGKELKSQTINSDPKNDQIITETKKDMIDQIKHALDKMRPFIGIFIKLIINYYSFKNYIKFFKAEDEEINESYQLWE